MRIFDRQLQKDSKKAEKAVNTEKEKVKKVVAPLLCVCSLVNLVWVTEVNVFSLCNLI